MNKNILTEQFTSQFEILKDKPANVLKRVKGVVSDFKSNRNGRIYPRELWENVVNSDYVKEMINNHSLFGEADHPETRLEISLQNVSHAINDLWIEDDKVMAIIDILPTPMGKIISELLDYGTNLGISSRGAGTVLADNSVDPDDYQFVTFDYVGRPSCAAARMNTILESAEIEASSKSDDDMKMILEEYSNNLKEDTRDYKYRESELRKIFTDEDYFKIKMTNGNSETKFLDISKREAKHIASYLADTIIENEKIKERDRYIKESISDLLKEGECNMKLNESILKNLKEAYENKFTDSLPENIVDDLLYMAKFEDLYLNDGEDLVDKNSKEQVLKYYDEEVGSIDLLHHDLVNYNPEELKDELSEEDYNKYIKAYNEVLDYTNKSK